MYVWVFEPNHIGNWKKGNMARRKKKYPWEKKYPENIVWDAEIPALPLHSILDAAAEKYPDRNCIDFYGKKYTYGDVNAQADKLAKGLQKVGVSKGKRVALLLPNCPQFVVSYFAVLKAGGIVVNCNPLYTLHELSQQIKDSGATVIVTLNLKALFEKTANLLQTTPLERVVVAEFQDALPFPQNMLFNLFKKKEVAVVPYGMINVSYQKLMDDSSSKCTRVDIDPVKDAAVYQYTGGTTGTPKAAVLTHANLYANVVQTGMWFDGLQEGEEKMMAVLPFFHVFAMTVVMNLSVHKGCEMILHPRLDVLKLLKDINDKKPTLLPGVPTLFATLNSHKKIGDFDLTSLKYCISGGAPLPLEVKERFEELSGCELIEGYGLSECSPVAVANPLLGEHRPGSIGIPLPGTIVEIRDTEGRRALKPQGKTGEICIEGPQVMKEYLNQPEETEEVLRSGRLHTGDMGYMDKDGYVYVVDRLKEMIIASGFNVYPREVEEEIYKHTSVEEAAVVGVPDNFKGQKVKAFIKLRKGEKLSKEDLDNFLQGKLAKYKLPSEVEFKEELPKTMVGKISKKELIKKNNAA